jgi:hypothetical protein
MMNENGARMLELCNTHRLRVGNTYFARGGAGTSKHPRRRRWVTLDYCLYNNAMSKLVQGCRVLKSFQCHTDHCPICVCLKTEQRTRTSKATCTRKCTRIEEGKVKVPCRDFELLKFDDELALMLGM